MSSPLLQPNLWRSEIRRKEHIDPDESIRWLKTAVRNGSDYAAYAMGKEHLSGQHVRKDAEKAAEYLHQAGTSGQFLGTVSAGQVVPDGQGRGTGWGRRLPVVSGWGGASQIPRHKTKIRLWR